MSSVRQGSRLFPLIPLLFITHIIRDEVIVNETQFAQFLLVYEMN